MIVLISLKVTLVALSEWSPNTYVYHAGHTPDTETQDSLCTVNPHV